MTTLDKSAAIDMLLQDRVLMIETLMQIEDKKRNLVPFKLMRIQRDLIESDTGRDVYVKPAQVGATSVVIADYLLDCLTVRGTVSIIISYNEFITGRLLRKAQSLYNIIKEQVPGIPELEHKSNYEKTFKGMNSSFYISSAGSYTFGRGETIHNLLIDEFAFWPPGEPERLFTSAVQRVPLEVGTKCKILSTPNGEDNDFHDVYAAAKEGKEIGKSVFTAHFYPWYIHEEYVMLPNNPFVLPNDDVPVLINLDTDEQNLLVRFEVLGMIEEVAHNRLRWRRYKMAEMASARRSGETRFLFGQEYPEDDISCFLLSGDMVYDVDLINDMARRCYPAPIHDKFADIWYPPVDGEKYLVAIDPGLGKTSESVATVWTFTEELLKHHATLSGYYPDDDMAEKSIALAEWYNGAVIANEDTLGITSHLKRYSNLYYRTDPASGRVGRTIGWATTPSTKPYMITEMNRHMSKIDTHDIRIVGQFRNIRWLLDRKGNDRAGSTGADDYHDSAAIAVVCRDTLPVDRGFVGTAGWDENWGK